MTRPATNPSDGWQPAAASTNRTQPTPAIDKCREATSVRLAHLATAIKVGKFSADLVNALHLHLLTHPHHLEGQRGAVFGELTEHSTSGVTSTEDRFGAIRRTIDAGAPAHRITGALIAAVADAAEKSLAASSWRSPNAGAVDWLRLIVTHTGYQLSDIEATAARLVDPTWAPASRHATPHPARAAAPATATRPTTRRTRGASR